MKYYDYIKLSFVGVTLLLLCGCWGTRRTHLHNLTGEQISVYSPKRNQWIPINTGADKTLCYEGKKNWKSWQRETYLRCT